MSYFLFHGIFLFVHVTAVELFPSLRIDMTDVILPEEGSHDKLIGKKCKTEILIHKESYNSVQVFIPRNCGWILSVGVLYRNGHLINNFLQLLWEESFNYIIWLHSLINLIIIHFELFIKLISNSSKPWLLLRLCLLVASHVSRFCRSWQYFSGCTWPLLLYFGFYEIGLFFLSIPFICFDFDSQFVPCHALQSYVMIMVGYYKGRWNLYGRGRDFREDQMYNIKWVMIQLQIFV